MGDEQPQVKDGQRVMQQPLPHCGEAFWALHLICVSAVSFPSCDLRGSFNLLPGWGPSALGHNTAPSQSFGASTHSTPSPQNSTRKDFTGVTAGKGVVGWSCSWNVNYNTKIKDVCKNLRILREGEERNCEYISKGLPLPWIHTCWPE